MAASSSSDRDDHDDDDKSPFRCLPAARFAAACLMTVLVLVVLVKAITVVHRVETLSLWIVQGAIFVQRNSTPEERLLFDFSLRASNPSIIARMHYFNVSVCLIGTRALASSPNPEYGCFVKFHIPDPIMVPQARLLDTESVVTGTRRSMLNSSAFDMLYNSKTEGIMNDVTMRLVGSLSVEDGLLPSAGSNRTTRRTSYYCWPLVVGPDPGNATEFLGLNLKDVYCREDTHFI